MSDDSNLNPHPESVECSQCHLAQDNITEENAYQLISAQEILCQSCHEESLKVSHPTGFTPDRALPAEFPVDWKGELTCSSCHNIHQQRHGSLKGNKSGKAFCLACHQAEFFQSMADGGASIQNMGHSGKRRKDNRSLIDAYSLQCMGCHSDKGDGPDVLINSKGIVKHSSGSNHPVGISYRAAMTRGRYRAESELSKSILLPNGNVSCVSCHNGYDKKHGALVKLDQRTSLCLECHDM